MKDNSLTPGIFFFKCIKIKMKIFIKANDKYLYESDDVKINKMTNLTTKMYQPKPLQPAIPNIVSPSSKIRYNNEAMM